MPRLASPLTDLRIKAAKPKEKPYQYKLRGGTKFVVPEITVNAQPTNVSNYDGVMKVLSDGTKVGLRNDSTAGDRTIDIFPINGKYYKVHIGKD